MAASLSTHHAGWAQYDDLLERALAPLEAGQLSLTLGMHGLPGLHL